MPFSITCWLWIISVDNPISWKFKLPLITKSFRKEEKERIKKILFAPFQNENKLTVNRKKRLNVRIVAIINDELAFISLTWAHQLSDLKSFFPALFLVVSGQPHNFYHMNCGIALILPRTNERARERKSLYSETTKFLRISQ